MNIIYFYLSLSVSIYLSIYLSISTYLSIYLSMCVCEHKSKVQAKKNNKNAEFSLRYKNVTLPKLYDNIFKTNLNL